MKILDDVRKHYLTQWGEPSRTASFQQAGHRVEVLKWNAERTPEQVNLYATVGLSAHALPGHGDDHRLEFFLGLLPAQDEVAGSLALLVIGTILGGREINHGHAVSFTEPLWKGTRMKGFLLLRSLGTIIPALTPSGSSLHVAFLQAIPLYETEVAFRASHMAGGLLEHWEAAGVRFWDPNRGPDPGE